MPQRLKAQPTARREHRGRSTAPSGPSKAAPSRTTAPGQASPDHSPEIEGVLELQRAVGNRAVTAAAAAGHLPNLLAIQRTGGTVQRADASEDGDATHNSKHREAAMAINDGIDA